MLYTLSDLHLSFAQDKPMDIFGPHWANHAEQIKRNWQQTVGQDDTVVLAGDTSWGIDLAQALPDFQFLDRLPGKKILLKGNHDYWWGTMRKMEEFLTSHGLMTLSFLHNNAYLCDGKIICGTRGWIHEFGVKQEDERLIAREAQRLKRSLEAGQLLKQTAPEAELIVFLHYPVVFGGFLNDELWNVLASFPVRRVYYGHLHNVRQAQLDPEYRGIALTLTACDYLTFMPLAIE